MAMAGPMRGTDIVAHAELRYPEIEPYETGMLDVGDGNLVYWETCGNPAGKPAAVVHAGPGCGCGPGHRRSFDGPLPGCTVRCTVPTLAGRTEEPYGPRYSQRFRAGAVEAAADGDLIAAYGRLMADPDPLVRARAAADWSAWEYATISLDPDGSPGSYSARPPELLLARARLCAYYFAHGAWLEEGRLLAGAHLLAGIPGVLIQGRMGAVIERSAHSGSAEMTARQVKALDDFAAARC